MYRHILFATDLTEETDDLLDKVRAIVRYTAACLTILHVVEPLPAYSYAYLGMGEVEAQLLAQAQQAIKQLGQRLSVTDERHLLVTVGITKTNILEVAEQQQVDLIVCGSHGRHGLSLLLGSTANAILHGAKCDVLTLRLPSS